MPGEAGSIGTLTACGEPHPIGLDPLDPGFRRRLDRDALTGRGMGALAERTGDASIAQTAISQIELALTAMRDGGHATRQRSGVAAGGAGTAVGDAGDWVP
jgi:hypothetical protein